MDWILYFDIEQHQFRVSDNQAQLPLTPIIILETGTGNGIEDFKQVAARAYGLALKYHPKDAK